MSGEKLVLRGADERNLWREMLVAATVSPRQCGVDGEESSGDQFADAAVRAYRERCGTADRFESLYKGIPFSKLTPEQLDEMKRTVFGTSEPVASDPEIRVVCRSRNCRDIVCDGHYYDGARWRLMPPNRTVGYFDVSTEEQVLAIAAELRAARNFPKSGGGA